MTSTLFPGQLQPEHLVSGRLSPQSPEHLRTGTRSRSREELVLRGVEIGSSAVPFHRPEEVEVAEWPEIDVVAAGWRMRVLAKTVQFGRIRARSFRWEDENKQTGTMADLQYYVFWWEGKTVKRLTDRKKA